ncbi:MAG: galactose-1-phosphate uridylyltransferase [candidate division Zixibacteria bacterium 4484_95]|nr:MAG: galactose-1-phosphate uridylyltransferase [candidate division Zixibacteria bacterium 4484_95]
MPELRKDPIVGRWVIISTERGKRPTDFARTTKTKEPKLCPFCPSNEASTPPEIYAVRDNDSAPNTPGWSLRVIPNKFPALKIEGDLNREGEGIFDKMNGIGAHEVIIETPDHMKDLVDLELGQIEKVIWAYRERILDLKKDPRFKYILIFKNQGEAAGASLEHAHSQLIATPILPKRVIEELDGSKRYYEYKERCIYCDIIKQELKSKIRVVAYNDMYVAIEPFASRFPFETWILPRYHEANFEYIKGDAISRLADLLKTILKKLSIALNNPPYNMVIHSLPLDSQSQKEYHWHIEIIPKLTKVAGFEWGTGFYINPTIPEDAAKYLIEVET